MGNQITNVSDVILPITYSLLKKLYDQKVENIITKYNYAIIYENQCEQFKPVVPNTVIGALNRVQSEYIYKCSCYEFIQFAVIRDVIHDKIIYIKNKMEVEPKRN